MENQAGAMTMENKTGSATCVVHAAKAPRLDDTMTSAVKDISLATYGRKEIKIAEIEMPGLMALRKEFGAAKPLQGAKITGSLHMTIQTAVLIETLVELGAEVRWCSCNIFSTQDHAAAAIADAKTAAVFAWKAETLEEYWWCTTRALDWGEGKGPDLIVDDGGDATLFIHEGAKAEAEFAKNGMLPDPTSENNAEMKIVKQLLRDCIPKDPQRFTRMSKNIKGVSEQTTTGVHRLNIMSKNGELLFPAININDCVTKSKFDNVYGCRHSLPDGIMRATDVMIAGKTAVVCGHGDVGKGCAQALRGCGAKVYVTEIDPICALQACMNGFDVVRLEDVIDKGDIFISTTGNKDVIMKKDMERMKNNAIVGNIGHFDNEIDMLGIESDKTIKRENIKPQVDRFVFPDGHGIIVLAEGRLLNLGCATGHPSFVMSCSFTNQTLAQMLLWQHRNDKKFDVAVHMMPKELDEKVARLHLTSLRADLTVMTPEQAAYVSLPVEGPYKTNEYRY